MDGDDDGGDRVSPYHLYNVSCVWWIRILIDGVHIVHFSVPIHMYTVAFRWRAKTMLLLGKAF